MERIQIKWNDFIDFIIANYLSLVDFVSIYTICVNWFSDKSKNYRDIKTVAPLKSPSLTSSIPVNEIIKFFNVWHFNENIFKNTCVWWFFKFHNIYCVIEFFFHSSQNRANVWNLWKMYWLHSQISFDSPTSITLNIT